MNEEPELLVSDPEGLVSVLEAEVLDSVSDSFREEVSLRYPANTGASCVTNAGRCRCGFRSVPFWGVGVSKAVVVAGLSGGLV